MRLVTHRNRPPEPCERNAPGFPETWSIIENDPLLPCTWRRRQKYSLNPPTGKAASSPAGAANARSNRRSHRLGRLVCEGANARRAYRQIQPDRELCRCAGFPLRYRGWHWWLVHQCFLGGMPSQSVGMNPKLNDSTTRETVTEARCDRWKRSDRSRRSQAGPA